MIKRILVITSLVFLTACVDDFRGSSIGVPGGANGGGFGAINDPTSVAYFEQNVGDRVLFAVDQYVLTPDHQIILDAQADWLLANPSFEVLIEGHTDEQGTREYNLALGARRAQSVYDYLVLRGVNADRLTTRSWGKERPIEICSFESCYIKNRRSVTVLSAQAI